MRRSGWSRTAETLPGYPAGIGRVSRREAGGSDNTGRQEYKQEDRIGRRLTTACGTSGEDYGIDQELRG